MAEDLDEDGQRLGHYDVVLPLDPGEGRLARLGRSDDGERYIALRISPPAFREHPTFAERLLDEAKRIEQVRHTNVANVLEVLIHDADVVVALDYLPGDTLAGLRAAAEDGTTEPRSLLRRIALRILVDALKGLHALHERTTADGLPLDLVHHDLSPRSILVGTDGITRVVDLGIARTAAGLELLALLPERIRSPEERRGDPVDRRADVWAAGVIAWEALAGRAMTREEREPEDGEPVRLKSVAADVSSRLDEVVARALAADPAARPATADAFAIELKEAARAVGMLADVDEIAEHALRLVGPKLIARRERVDAVRRAQARRPRSMPDVRTMIGIGTASDSKRPPLPTLPDFPATSEPVESALRLDLGSTRTLERADDDILGEPISVPEEDVPEVMASPVVLGDPEERPAARARHAAEDAFARARTVVGPWLRPPWTTKKISVLSGVGCGLLGFSIVLIAASGGKKTEPTTVASASAPVTVATVEPPPPPAPVATAEDDNPAAAVLNVTANLPIATVHVSGRVVEAVVPAPTVGVDLTDEERDSPLRLVVTSTDGRSASSNTNAGELDVAVTFGDKPPPPKPARPAPANTVKHPWSSKRPNR